MIDDDARPEAFELFMIEAGRVRLAERSGRCRLRLRSGAVVVGVLVPATDSAGHLLGVVAENGADLLVATSAVTSIIRTSTGLRDESPRSRDRSLASRLRESWTVGSVGGCSCATGAGSRVRWCSWLPITSD